MTVPAGDPGPEPRPGAAPDRRGYRAALVVLAVGAALLFLGYAQTWATAVVTQRGLPTVVVTLSGRDLQPGGAASAILALAGIAGLVATRRVGRVVSGLLLVVSGVGAGLAAVVFGLGGHASVDVLVSERVGVDVAAVTTTTSWWLAAAAGGLLVALAGLAAVARGGRWPVLGARYGRTGAAPGPAPAAAPAAGAWDRLDRGEDPTLGPDDDATPGNDPVAGT